MLGFLRKFVQREIATHELRRLEEAWREFRTGEMTPATHSLLRSIIREEIVAHQNMRDAKAAIQADRLAQENRRRTQDFSDWVYSRGPFAPQPAGAQSGDETASARPASERPATLDQGSRPSSHREAPQAAPQQGAQAPARALQAHCPSEIPHSTESEPPHESSPDDKGKAA